MVSSFFCMGQQNDYKHVPREFDKTSKYTVLLIEVVSFLSALVGKTLKQPSISL